MAKRLEKVPRLPKETLTAQTKMNSTNTRRMYMLAGCYYLITKGWSFLISKEQRIAEKLHHFFPIQKIWNENKVIIFDKDCEYELIQEGKEAKLKFDKEEIPIKKEVTEKSGKQNKKKLVYNELVVMNIINECYLKYNEIGSDNSLAHTKVSKSAISSQQYTKLPLVKKDGKCIGIFNKIEVLNTTGIQVYDFLCQYLKKEKSSQTKYESVFIGDKDCLSKTSYGNILLLSKEKFLDQAIDESKFNCFNDKVSSSSQQLNEGVKILQLEPPTNISSSMEDNPLNNIRGSPFVEHQRTVVDYSSLPVKSSEILPQFECLSNKGVISKNNKSELLYFDINKFKRLLNGIYK
ncbi:hypothetical protein CL6EHI_191520 [Entamoeba histolytica]|uniref:Uncharacterized protein n=2 Tax=Entamoeba histolytica TaxID=5759 RepID=C4M8J7_ENTH1|nr:hypothetical protein EHI_191520 [Entamoeba histolytica HM-1:IMSS]EAL46141.1 hypothetical protein EHI_191520 [Entamoeba histolytica HM-1:IMSS]BAN38010.1 hypothetical protein [Entamoeba histolytica]GAT97933.1 hypothetical protein CL6EHI_191520 [Entamoeba histolytica]|eukprot:XP_651528.1 hypothetical protein EHI_191520 [Entamoeba histolytica HM-1:IMSS]